MDKYFSLECDDGAIEVASAFFPKNTKLSHELIEDLEGLNELPFELSLIKLTIEKNGLKKDSNLAGLDKIWLDFQPNEFAWPLFSENLKNIVVKALTGYEGIDWISADIYGNDEHKTYYIPRFKSPLDVLDHDQTLFVTDTDLVIRPVFSKAKIQKYSVFHIPSSSAILWKITCNLYVSEVLKRAIQKEKLSWITFGRATTS